MQALKHKNKPNSNHQQWRIHHKLKIANNVVLLAYQENVTHHASHVTLHTLHVTCDTSHVTRHTSHVTRHTLHVTHHTSHQEGTLHITTEFGRMCVRPGEIAVVQASKPCCVSCHLLYATCASLVICDVLPVTCDVLPVTFVICDVLPVTLSCKL